MSVILVTIYVLGRWFAMLVAPNVQDLWEKVFFQEVLTFCRATLIFCSASRLLQAVSTKCCIVGSKFYRQVVPTPMPNNPPSLHLYEFKSVSGPRTSNAAAIYPPRRIISRGKNPRSRWSDSIYFKIWTVAYSHCNSACNIIDQLLYGRRCQKVFCDSGEEGASAGRSPTR